MENMTTILIPMAVLGGLGIAFAILLSFASHVFHVKVDRRVEAVRKILPGANCGACGFPGCDGLAKAIALEGAPINSCPIGGQKLIDDLAELLGQTADAAVRNVAVVKCQGDKTRAKDKFEYVGVRDCRANAALQGGNKSCTYGCLGCGTCQDVCQFGAIEMVNGVAVIDRDLCTACRKCVDICPKNIIDMISYDDIHQVLCKSRDAGKEVRSKCSVGCIACKICTKQYPEAFEIDNNLAKRLPLEAFDQEKMLNAVDKCPTKCIFPGLERKAIADKEKQLKKEAEAKKAEAEENKAEAVS